MAFELQQLRQVLALAEHGSFVRAASALHISQPALSRSIQNLERGFGNELFVRSPLGVVPTDLGRVYLERVRDILRMADELQGEAVGLAAQRTGRVAIGGGPFPSESFLAEAVVRFNARYPRVSVALHAQHWDELLRMLRSRELDFFVAETSTLGREPDLDIVTFRTSHTLYWAVRAGHPLAGRHAVTSAQALEWPFASPSRVPPRILDPLLAVRRRAGTKPALPFPAFACNGLASAKRIVLSSDAVTASVLSCIRDELDQGRLVLIGTEPWMHLHYGLVSLKNRPWTQPAAGMHELVLEAEQESSAEEARLARIHHPDARRPAPASKRKTKRVTLRRRVSAR
jgi:DNA-binding transcriptional LysR family regulator